MIDNCEKNRCNGCYACYNICPVGALTMNADSEGFDYPVINDEKCIKCKKCNIVCPISYDMKSINRKELTVFAAWSLNEEIRLNSTSGGIFSELAQQVLKRAGYVCGAVYCDDYMVEHYITGNIDDLERIRQSKYIQSSINDVYRKVGKLLADGKEVLFSGTPCECGGLYYYLKHSKISRDKLILVDFVCRGSNSPKVYHMFLKHLEERYGSKVKKVWFKNKAYGWNRFSTRIEFENGESYNEDRFSDIYIRGYIEANLYMRPSCSKCAFKGFPRFSDITLGDYWGVELCDKSQNTDLGTSLVILNSLIGDKLFEEIMNNIFCEVKTLEDAAKSNPCMYQSVVHNPNRELFMKELDKMNIMDNINCFLNNSKGRQ